MDYEAFAEAGAMIGHGGIVVFDDTMDAADMARFAMSSAPRSPAASAPVPDRVGAWRRGHRPDPVSARCRQPPPGLRPPEDLCTTMEKGSLCAMGGLTPMPVRSALRHFPADFAKNPPVDSDKNPPVDSDKNPPIVHFFRRRGYS